MLALFLIYKLIWNRQMTDFSYLKQVDVRGAATQEYPISQISVGGKTPVLLVTSATEANPGYWNAILTDSIKNARAVKKNGITIAVIKKNRDRDRELYPKHVITGWCDVVDGSGKEVPFTVDDCKDFVTQLPDWIFDDLRNYCSEPTNHIDSFDIELTAKK